MGKADGRVIEVVPAGRLDEGYHPPVIETGQFDARYLAMTAHGTDHFHQGTRTGDLRVPIRPDDEQLHCKVGAHDVAKQEQASWISPLQVVENEEDWLGLRRHGKEGDDGGEKQEPFRFRVGGLRWRESRYSARQCRNQPAQFGAVQVHVGPKLLVGGVRDVVRQGFGKELIWSGKVLLAMAEENARPSLERGPRRLGHERRLPQTGFACYECDSTAFTIRAAFDRLPDAFQFYVPPDYPEQRAVGQSPGQGDDLAVGTGEWLPHHFEGTDGILEALQGELAH